MSATVEHSVIDRTPQPVTRSAICAALGAAGVRTGASIIVHSSLSRIGWVVGGAHTVVNAILDTVGPLGTVTMPSMSSDLSDPARWEAPPVPESWWQIIREEMPAFDAHLTPTTHMGAVVECFRHVPGAVRGDHPADSFVSFGPLAQQIVRPHPLSPAFGDGSPLSRLYDLDARIVLVGVGHANNTSLHLASGARAGLDAGHHHHVRGAGDARRRAPVGGVRRPRLRRRRLRAPGDVVRGCGRRGAARDARAWAR